MIKEKLSLIWGKFVNRETISYLIFGVLTTLVDWISYAVFRHNGMNYRMATICCQAAAILFALLICLLQGHLMPLCSNQMVFNLLCSLIVGAGIVLAARLLPALQPDQVMIGDIMLLIPGIAMTNAVRDILVGETISGIMRLIESLLWAGALAAGFMVAIWLIGG